MKSRRTSAPKLPARSSSATTAVRRSVRSTSAHHRHRLAHHRRFVQLCHRNRRAADRLTDRPQQHFSSRPYILVIDRCVAGRARRAPQQHFSCRAHFLVINRCAAGKAHRCKQWCQKLGCNMDATWHCATWMQRGEASRSRPVSCWGRGRQLNSAPVSNERAASALLTARWPPRVETCERQTLSGGNNVTQLVTRARNFEPRGLGFLRPRFAQLP